MPAIQSKRYQFTWNNYSDEDVALCKSFFDCFCVYGVYAKERGEEGTPHLQGYFELKNKTTIVGLKKKFSPKIHMEMAQGTAAENIGYCVGPYESKDGKKKKPYNAEHYVFGEPMAQGKRTDIAAILQIIAAGPSHCMEKIIQTGANYQCIRHAQLVLSYLERKRDWIPTILWLHGPTGTGKTETAAKLAKLLGEDPYFLSCKPGKEWWQGYDAHSFVIIDDYRTNWMPYNQLLTLLDSKPYSVEYKGGSRQLLARTMVVTCPKPPDALYFEGEDNKQLLRRITKSLHIDGSHTPEEYALALQEALFPKEKETLPVSHEITEEEALGTAATCDSGDSGDETDEETLSYRKFNKKI